MKDNKIFFAPIKSRFFAFLIDFLIVYGIRILYINLIMSFFLKEEAINFSNKYQLLYGNFNIENITRAEITFFLQSNLLKILIVFFIVLFFISSIYNIICLSSRWSSTIGQKILDIHIVSSNGKKINVYQIILRSILIVIPWFFMFILIILILINAIGLTNIFGKNFMLLSVFAFISWYDMIFFTKDKIMFHDLITKTRVILNNPKNYNNEKNVFLNFLFPDFKGMYNNLKQIISKQILEAKKIKKEYKKRKNNK